MDGKLYQLQKGQLVLFHPNEAQFYQYEKKNHPDVYWIHFVCTQNQQLDSMHILSINKIQTCISYFEQIIQELQLKEPYHIEREKLLIQELLVFLAREQIMKNQSVVENDNIKNAIKEFHQNYASDISIKEYCKQQGLNYYHFIDTFSKYTGMPPKQYITHLRLVRAREMLHTTNLQINEISLIVGYDNSLYFSRIFSKYFECSPSDYRKEK